MEFKKFQNKIFVHVKTLVDTYIRLLDQFLGSKKKLTPF